MPGFNVNTEDYRLNSIEFENYKSYLNKQTLSFVTTRRFANDQTTEKKFWTSRETVKYKKVIGVWGKNASGKTSFVEVMARWDQLFAIANQLGIAANYNARSLVEQNGRIDRHIQNGENPSDVFKYTVASDPKKPTVISLTFECKEMKFKYSIFEQAMATEKGINHILDDRLEVIRGAKNDWPERIWDSTVIDWPIPKFLNFVESYEKNSVKKSLEETARFILGTADTVDDNKTDFVVNAIKNWHLLQKAFSILNLFHANNLPLMVSPIYSSKESMLSQIEEMSSRLHNFFKVPVEKIESVITYLIKSIDKNVSSVNYQVTNTRGNNLMGNSDTKKITLSSMVSVHGGKYFSEDLSQGTLLFIDIFISTWLQDFGWANEKVKLPKYLFIDELGQNWHTNLSVEFINLITSGILGNVVLVFTSHDANIGDSLSPDSIWMIDNESKLKSADNSLSSAQAGLRKNKKFSSDYLNDSVDLYSTNPELDNLMNVGDLMNDK